MINDVPVGLRGRLRCCCGYGEPKAPSCGTARPPPPRARRERRPREQRADELMWTIAAPQGGGQRELDFVFHVERGQTTAPRLRPHRYLTSTRQGWLAWRESKSQEPRKEEFFVLKTDGALTLHRAAPSCALVRRGEQRRAEKSVAVVEVRGAAPAVAEEVAGRGRRPDRWTSSKTARTSRSTTTWKRIRAGASPR